MTLLKYVRAVARGGVAAAVLVVAAGALPCGCVAGRTFVLEQPAPATVHTGFTLQPLGEQIEIDPSVQLEFHEILTRRLTEELGIAPSANSDLLVQYRITLFDEGEGAVRVGSTLTNIVGSPFYGMGDGAVGIEVRFARPNGSMLGHIVTDGSIAGAFGSTSSALEDAAGSIARYTKLHFICPTCADGGLEQQAKLSDGEINK